ncbi:MAG: LexA family transcriptional regulator [Bacteroides sp.]|nr:LexA family transcriptional regulator [Bacteroides sp.]
MAKTHLSVALKGGKYLTDGFLRRFAAAYSDYINEEWLLTGEGVMEKPDSSQHPHIEAQASAGFMDGISEGEWNNKFHDLDSFMRNQYYDFTIRINGDSMEPNFLDDDIVMCRIINDRLNPPIGKVCVIDSKEGALLKEIAGETDGAIILHSFTPKYKDYSIPAEDVLQIAEVIGLLRPKI